MFTVASETRAQNAFGTVSVHPVGQSVLYAVSIDSLQKSVKRLTGEEAAPLGGGWVTIPHRYNGSTAFLQSAEYVYAAFARYGLYPFYENNISPFSRVNVVGTLPGVRGAMVLLTAHLDSKSPSCPGADDNASGVAVMLEAARILRQHGFQYSIRFIAFGGEEWGLLGSQQYVADHPLDSIHAVINCDMVMWDGNGDGKLQVHARQNTGSMRSEDLADYLIGVDAAYQLPGSVVKVVPGTNASDHSPFWNAGRSSVLLIEDMNDFNPFYHTASDNWATHTASRHQALFLGAARLAAVTSAHLALPVQPIPVTLVSFDAEIDDRRVLLHWRTAEERNNSGFEVQRREGPSGQFRALGFVPARGSRGAVYEWTDLPGAMGRYEYRLRQIDLDGTTAYTHTVSVVLSARPQRFALRGASPHPVRVISRITYEVPADGRLTLRVLDMLGRECARLVDGPVSAGTHEAVFDRGGLPDGAYMLVLDAGDALVSRPILLHH